MIRTLFAAVALLLLPGPADAQTSDIPRTATGKPDLSGTYDAATLTPLERPEKLGEKMALTDEEAAEITKWLGDSIGWWEGNTLVVETTNFVDRPAFTQGSGNMTVTERFRMQDADTLAYTFTVDDPTVWTRPFTG